MSFVLYAILIYVAYLFIFRLVIPVYLASRKIKKGFREMHQRMQEQQASRQGTAPQPEQGSRTASVPNMGSKPKSGDYLEFEEVK